MFDYILCEFTLPNLPLEFLAHRGGNSSEIMWQTKDIDNSISYYKIESSGILLLEKYEGVWSESDPVENIESASCHEKLKALGSYIRTKTWWEPVLFTGTINFYEVWHHLNYKIDINNQHKFETGWVEYKAIFYQGLLQTIELFLVEDPIEYSEEQIQENEIKFKIQRAELENNLRQSRSKYPTPEQKLIDSIMDIIHSPECIHDEWGMVSKLNNIEDIIIEYRKQFDIWK